MDAANIITKDELLEMLKPFDGKERICIASRNPKDGTLMNKRYIDRAVRTAGLFPERIALEVSTA